MPATLITLCPTYAKRIMESEERIRRRMVSVDESMARASAMAASMASKTSGVVLEEVDDEDSLVINIESIARCIA